MTRDEKKQEWLEKRRNYITGTDAAALLGIVKFNNKFKVWLDKLGQAEPLVDNEKMRWGKLNEPTILRAYAESVPDHKFVNVDGYELITSEKYPRLGASLDGWDDTEKCPVDAKNIQFVTAEYGDAGTDEIPEYYKTQLHVQMAVTGADHAKLAVLFGGCDFRVYTIQRDDKLIEKINSEAEKFWAEHVETKIQPEVGGDEQSTNWVKEHYAKAESNDKSIEPTKEILETAMKLKEAKERVTAAENDESLYANRLKVMLGEAAVCKGVCTWKNNKDKTTTNWELVAKHFSGQEGFDDVVKANTTTKPGARSLRLSI